jgi:pimeloyl-ACP methyl ester carboxylesterase
MSEKPQPSPESLGATEKPSIDEQINTIQSLEVLDGKVDFTEVTPEQTKTEVPVILAPGWGGTIVPAFKETMRTFAQMQRRSIAIEHPFTVKKVSEKIPTKLRESHPIEEVRKAAALLEFLQKKDIEKTDVLAHSEGAIYVLLAASAEPEKFRGQSIVLSNPAGLIGKDNLFDFVVRGTVGVRGKRGPKFPGEKEKVRPISLAKGEGKLGFILSQPLTAFRDFRAITQSDVHSLLRELHGQGIRIAILAGVDDPMFPMERLQATLKKGDELDGFLSLKGGHVEILNQPKRYAAVIEKIYTALEAK